MKLESDEARADFLRRLRRIEGQLRGIRGMVEDERDCRDVVQQLNAASAAMKGAGQQFMRAYARECLLRAETLERSEAQFAVDDLMDLLAKLK